MRKPLALLAALLLTASVAAGCGGDDGGDESAGTTATSDADDGTTTTTAAADGTDAPTGGANPDSPYCQAAASFAGDPVLQNIDFQDPDQAAHAVELLTAMRDTAPDDLQDDLQLVIDGFTAIADALRAAGDDTAAQQDALGGLQGQFEDLSSASANVSTFTQTECGIDVNDTGTGTGTETDTGTEDGTDG